MTDKRKKIILFPNPRLDAGYKVTDEVRAILERSGRQTVTCPLPEDETGTGHHPANMVAAEFEAELPFAEMIITFGGDGTILRAARAAADHGVPILGINMGGKGFLTELETDEIMLVGSAATGKYNLGKRMMLDVTVDRGGGILYNDCALNDVVIKGDNKVIDLSLYGDGQRISFFTGDGAIIATPTGSTAYSMAAGGPIVEPAAHNIIITPICAHVLEAKSFILASDRRVSVGIENRKRNPAYISVDGANHLGLLAGDTVEVSKSEKCTRFVRLSNKSFYKKVSEKLGDRVGYSEVV